MVTSPGQKLKASIDRKIKLIRKYVMRLYSERSCLYFLLAVVLCSMCTKLFAQESYLPDGVLKVCQDPDNLPFSNARGEGFENKIAELLAKKLGWKLAYTDFPQRMGFIRNTLKFKLPGENFRCDLVMGLPADYDQAATTAPYFRSSYVLVIADENQTAGVNSEAEFLTLPRSVRDVLRIGVFIRSPGVRWLMQNELIEQAIPYRSLDADPDHHPGDIIEHELVSGKIDAALVWGPVAAYYASKVTTKKLKVITLQSYASLPLSYGIAMGVRHEDKAWKAKVEQLLQENRAEIRDILHQYQVPFIEEP